MVSQSNCAGMANPREDEYESERTQGPKHEIEAFPVWKARGD